jgi:hypothetical protein
MFHKQQQSVRMQSKTQKRGLSPREYIIFLPIQLLGNGNEQRPSNECDLESIVTGAAGTFYCTGTDTVLVLFLYCRTLLLLGFSIVRVLSGYNLDRL